MKAREASLRPASGEGIASSAPPLRIAISIRSAAWNRGGFQPRALCRRAANAAFATAALPVAAEVSIVLADDDFIRTLNREFRGRDRATNVLSFPALDSESTGLMPEQPALLGDIVVAYETMAAEAEAEGRDLADHLSHLIVHGMLHLLGHDHETDEQASAMESLEVQVLARLGIANPYRERT